MPANRFLMAKPSSSSSSFRITATLLFSPFSISPSRLASGELLSRRAWYRVCQNCSSAVCTCDFNAPRNWPIPTVSFPRDVQIAGDREEKERRKQRVRTTSKLWQAQYRRSNGASRERVGACKRHARMQIEESWRNGVAATTNSVIDGGEVIP